MFYRRKILLALVEAFGGAISEIDCQKLLLLFEERRGENYYDFFPSNRGNFSLILAQDKGRLTDLDFLVPGDTFQISTDQSYLDKIKSKDLIVLQALVSEIGDLRGEELIRKVYLELPYYASRSQIAASILNVSEYEQVHKSRNTAKTPGLFTVGYEGLSIDAYLNMLIANNINVLVDVRKNPISRKYGFSKKRLAAYTKLADITYIHIPDLGISPDLRQDLSSPESYQKLFDLYASQILPAQQQAIEQLKTVINENNRVAITCFEATYHSCHRHKITEYLEADPRFVTPITHLSKDYSCTIKHS
jgi:uncharacterized protein (DUF488 family)